MVKKLLQKHKVWIFPATVILVLGILTICRISGSSVGMFYKSLYGASAKDPNLLLNQPRAIRSDEWEVVTPLTISQTTVGMPSVNPNIGSGQNMTLVLDVPTKHWSTFFKPQNWAFFVASPEYAFAFKWWFLGALCMLSCYFLSLVLFPKKILFAALFSIGVFFSPFIQWWYQTITLAPIFYSFFIVALAICICKSTTTRKQAVIYSSLLAYVLTCFSFVLYVPFLVPCALVVVAVLCGHIANLYLVKKDRKTLRQRILYVLTAGVLAGALFLTYLHQHKDVLSTISSTVYPGQRTEKSGGMDPKHLLGGAFNAQLQSDDKAKYLPPTLNQSEASTFLLLSLYLVPSSVYLLITQRKKTKRVDYRLVALMMLGFVFAARVFVPASDAIFRFVQFDRIPHNRLIIGFGLLNFMFLLIFLQYQAKQSYTLSKKIHYGSSLFAFLVTLGVGLSIKTSYPGYINNTAKIIAVSIIVACIIHLYLAKKPTTAAFISVLLIVASTAQVNPLYRGLYPITNSALKNAVSPYAQKSEKWVVSDFAILENVTSSYGLPSLSGVYAYPQLALWEPLRQQPSDEDIYNRYAHVFFSIENIDTPTIGAYLDPPALDAFRVHADPCKQYMKDMNVGYILTSESKGSLPCLNELDRVVYPTTTFYIYKIVR